VRLIRICLTSSPPLSYTITLPLHDALPIFRHASTHHPSPPTPQCKRLRLSCARDSDQFSRNDPVTLAPRGLSHTACPMQVASCRSEEHTSELQSRFDLVCRLLLEKKK